MANRIIKELIISLLLCLAIILVLGIIFYEYVPMSKVIPNPVSYTTPENVKQELATINNEEDNKIIMTYEIDSTDLNNYKNIQNYRPGKANPFSSYLTSSGSADTSSTVTNGNTVNSNSSTTQGSSSSGGSYFQDKGTK